MNMVLVFSCYSLASSMILSLGTVPRLAAKVRDQLKDLIAGLDGFGLKIVERIPIVAKD